MNGSLHFPKRFGEYNTVIFSIALHQSKLIYVSLQQSESRNYKIVEKTQLENTWYVSLYFSSKGSSVETTFDQFFLFCFFNCQYSKFVSTLP